MLHDIYHGKRDANRVSFIFLQGSGIVIKNILYIFGMGEIDTFGHAEPRFRL